MTVAAMDDANQTSPVAEVEPMDDLSRLVAAKDELNLVLGFFGRVETKLSVVLAIDLAMLSVAFAKALPVAQVGIPAAIGLGLFTIPLILSFAHLYRGSFPDLQGGHASLIFFREIAKLRESEFVARFSSLSADALAKDLLGQAWRNAKILTTKFDRLKSAYSYMALAAIPWAVSLALLAYQAPR